MPNEVVAVEERVRLVAQPKDIEIETVRIKEVEKIVEKIVSLTGADGDEEGCISQAGFVNMWNSMMHIPYTGDDITEDCVDEEAFMSMVSQNISKNFSKFKKQKYENSEDYC